MEVNQIPKGLPQGSPFAVLSGGCNPYPIFAEDREDSEEAVRISYDFLSGAESLFTRWKENGK